MLESTAMIFAGEKNMGAIKRNLLLQKISSILNIPGQALYTEIDKIRRQLEKNNDLDEYKITLHFTELDIVERDLIMLLVRNPKLGNEVFLSLPERYLKHNVFNKIYATMKRLWLKGDFNSFSDIVDVFEDREISRFIIECIDWDMHNHETKNIMDALQKLQQREFKLRMNELEQKIKEAHLKGDTAEDLISLQFRMNKVANKEANYSELLKEIEAAVQSKKT